MCRKKMIALSRCKDINRNVSEMQNRNRSIAPRYIHIVELQISTKSSVEVFCLVHS